MSIIEFFSGTKVLEEDAHREKETVSRIRQEVSRRCGIDNFIIYDDFTVAFAGSKEDMKLMLDICTQKFEGKKYLYVSIDDEFSWQEWDYENTDDFENNIIDFIANRVNRTIKTVTKIYRKNCTVASYYLNENKEWVCFEEDSTDIKWFCVIASLLFKSNEIIREYKLEN